MELATLDILCKTCGAKLTLEAHLRTAQCPYCDSPAVVDRPQTVDRPDPTFVIGFVLDRDVATQRVQRFLKSRGIFAHSGLKTASLEKVRGVYLPAYPGVRFEGRVQGIGWGVEQQNDEGAQGSDGVPKVNPTVDWVRMAQRFPVRIALLAADADHPFRKGMRASVRIDTTVEGFAPEEASDEAQDARGE